MNVQIIGAGSVGLLAASYLHQAGLNVTIVCRTKRQYEALQKNGLIRVNMDGSKIHSYVNVSRDMNTDADVTIVTTKSHQLETLYEPLNGLKEQSVILFMQNGLAHYEKALKLRQQHIAFASVQFGALKESDNEVRHTGVGVMKVAFAKGERTQLPLYTDIVDFPIQYVSGAFNMLFEKALLNCFINPLTAILQVKNGVLVKNSYAYEVLQQLYKELNIAFAKEMKQFTFEQVVTLCEKTASNNSSMLMDRMNHRLSEIDAIVLPVLIYANENGSSLPTLQTLYNLVKAIEMERE